MSTIDRRMFLGAGAGATVAAGATQVAATEKEAGGDKPVGPPPPQPPIVDLGNTGVRVSRLAQGTGVKGGRRQSDQSRLGFEQLVRLFHHAYDRGITFFDLADLYGTHIYFREALRTIPRDKIAILTKIWWPYDGPEDRTHEKERRQDTLSTLERFRHELTTDYLDVVLLHCLKIRNWVETMQPYMGVLDEEKKAGRIRAVGVSCHDFGAMETAASEPWVDVILARINPRQVRMDETPEKVAAVLRTARQNGKAVIGMKIFGEGQLVDERDYCIKYAQEQGLMDAMTIGFHAPEQIDEVLKLLAKYPARS